MVNKQNVEKKSVFQISARTNGWRGVRRFGTPNLRHTPALNWKCEMLKVGKQSVNASLAKGELIDGMIAS